ncbi:universal stress protein [Streptomyces sp. N35]|uniref:universal stress protein n=1 Tax=Streptomyces sp. N35 TaxID=2795730 RepID=UPI0018F2D369|nr:universal stress protein [Streptomyces sp. N35]
MEVPSHGALIVGVDGSAAALAALRWSAAKALLFDAPVVAVHAWLPSGLYRAPYAPAGDAPTVEQDRHWALRTLEETVAQLHQLDPAAVVVSVLDQGPPAAVLLHHARHALLLALGRRTRQDATVAPSAAVTRACERNAMCPVITVPELPQDAKASDLPWLDLSAPA